MTSILHREIGTSKGRNLALIAGSIQLVLAFGLLFLPIFGTCMQNEAACRYQNYIQMGGSALGYLFFGAMILLGGVIIIASRSATQSHVHSLLLVGIGACLVVAMVAAWSFGLAFAPIALILLLADRALQTTK